MPAHLLHVRGLDVERADERVRLAVVELVLAGRDGVQEEPRLVGVPRRDRRVHRHDGRIAAPRGHARDPADRRAELLVGHDLSHGRLGERAHGVGVLVLDQALAQIGNGARPAGAGASDTSRGASGTAGRGSAGRAGDACTAATARCAGNARTAATTRRACTAATADCAGTARTHRLPRLSHRARPLRRQRLHRRGRPRRPRPRCRCCR